MNLHERQPIPNPAERILQLLIFRKKLGGFYTFTPELIEGLMKTSVPFLRQNLVNNTSGESALDTMICLKKKLEEDGKNPSALALCAKHMLTAAADPFGKGIFELVNQEIVDAPISMFNIDIFTGLLYIPIHLTDTETAIAIGPDEFARQKVRDANSFSVNSLSLDKEVEIYLATLGKINKSTDLLMQDYSGLSLINFAMANLKTVFDAKKDPVVLEFVLAGAEIASDCYRSLYPKAVGLTWQG